ncbi:MAG: hypothetical protein ACTSP2_05210, partial [Alphaproteobacteria bacterium]
ADVSGMVAAATDDDEVAVPPVGSTPAGACPLAGAAAGWAGWAGSASRGGLVSLIRLPACFRPTV